MEKTLLLIKPDAYENHHIGEIISILEKKRAGYQRHKIRNLHKRTCRRFL